MLVKLVGTEKILSRERLVSYFRIFLMTRVKTYLAQVMKESELSIFEVDEHLTEFSTELKKRLNPDFAEYGVCLEKFFITRIVKPDGDSQYEKFKDLHFRKYADVAEARIKQQVGVIEQQTESQKMLIEAQGIAQKRNIEGYTYQQERGFDVAEKIASNEGAENFSSTGIGLGMMAGVGGAVGSSVGAAFTDAVGGIYQSSTEEMQFCDNCGAKIIPGASFCDACGTQIKKQQNSCPICGYTYERPGKFCPKCGNKREG